MICYIKSIFYDILGREKGKRYCPVTTGNHKPPTTCLWMLLRKFLPVYITSPYFNGILCLQHECFTVIVPGKFTCHSFLVKKKFFSSFSWRKGFFYCSYKSTIILLFFHFIFPLKEENGLCGGLVAWPLPYREHAQIAEEEPPENTNCSYLNRHLWGRRLGQIFSVGKNLIQARSHYWGPHFQLSGR